MSAIKITLDYLYGVKQRLTKEINDLEKRHDYPDASSADSDSAVLKVYKEEYQANENFISYFIHNAIESA